MKAKKTILYIIIIVLLVVIGVLFIVILTSENNNGNVVISNHGAASLDNMEISSDEDYKTEIDSANKKLIFINYLYSYKISFPDDWTVDEIYQPDYVAFYDSVAKEQEIVTELLQGMKIDVFVLSAESGMTLEDKVDEEVMDMDESMIERKDTFVDTQPAIKVKMDVLGYSVATYVLYSDYFYIIAGYIGAESEIEKYTALYSSILSDFTFLE